ncbi:MAG: hypothetical protein JNG89_21315 [Planctomycetaceae bacterium]|nr:hypothetical protein [Planctomycetaceae bacterium]
MKRACVFAILLGLAASGSVRAADPAAAQPAVEPTADGAPVALNPQKTVLLDRTHGRLLLKAKVVLREGVLEMLICKAQTKEHESILSIDADAYLIHAGLLLLGAQPGSPATYDTQFHPPTGQEIDIHFAWTDEQGQEQRVHARTWVRHVTRRYYEAPLAKVPAGVTVGKGSDLRYDEKNKLLIWFGQMSETQRDALLKLSANAEYQAAITSFFDDSRSREIDAQWVFAGSGFFEQEDGRKYYMAESGDVVCVANFGDALLDVTVESSSSNDQGLLFEPYTERVPPLGTEVTVELTPVKGEGE